jgi:hypothetical protein
MAHPVSDKKLFEDGIWDTRKEILGWLFDGMARTIELPHHKFTELLLELKTRRRLPKLEVKRFQKLHGRLQFVTIAIPDAVPPQQQSYIKSLFQAAKSAIDFGVVVSTTNERICFWKA